MNAYNADDFWNRIGTFTSVRIVFFAILLIFIFIFPILMRFSGICVGNIDYHLQYMEAKSTWLGRRVSRNNVLIRYVCYNEHDDNACLHDISHTACEAFLGIEIKFNSKISNQIERWKKSGMSFNINSDDDIPCCRSDLSLFFFSFFLFCLVGILILPYFNNGDQMHTNTYTQKPGVGQRWNSYFRLV